MKSLNIILMIRFKGVEGTEINRTLLLHMIVKEKFYKCFNQ